MVANPLEMLMSKLEKETVVMQQSRATEWSKKEEIQRRFNEEEGKMQGCANNNDAHFSYGPYSRDNIRAFYPEKPVHKR